MGHTLKKKQTFKLLSIQKHFVKNYTKEWEFIIYILEGTQTNHHNFDTNTNTFNVWARG